MNDEIRAAVQARLEQKHMSRSDLARAVGSHPNTITRALNGGKDGGGKVPALWAAILEALDLDLTVSPKKASGEDRKPGEEKKASTPTPSPEDGPQEDREGKARP